MILPRKNGLLKLKMQSKKQTWIANFVLDVQVIIIMIKALNLIFQIRIFSKAIYSSTALA
jgi:hypothetical protein